MLLLNLKLLSKELSKILCIDPGIKNLGLAVSDADRVISFAKKVVPNSSEGLNEIAEFCQQEQIGLIVIGKPLYADKNNQSEALKQALAHLKIDIQFYNEDYSTSEAFELMSSVNMPQEEQQKMKDAFAAKLILEKYLASNQA